MVDGCKLGVASSGWRVRGGECLCGNLAKRTKRERGKKGIWDWVSDEEEGF